MSYEQIQQSVRAETGTALTYEEDWHALFTNDGIGAGEFNERMREWINVQLSSSYQDLNDAMRAFAADQGFASWGEMQGITFGVGGGPSGSGILLEIGDYTLAENGNFLILEA